MAAFGPILLIRLFVLLFLTVLFIQSGIDKVLHFKPNKEWFVSYFKSTFLAGFETILLAFISLLELFAGLLCIVGLFYCQHTKNDFALLGFCLSAFTLICLFAGQRLAKDYQSAAAMTGYFLIVLLGLYSFV